MATILLIEDDVLQRQLALHTLQAAGHTVHEAEDGEQGVYKARLLKPDAIVCDVVMPHKNGYQVLAELRQDPQMSAVPVILLTSMSERAQVRLGMSSGADDYLPKPWRPNELTEAIDAVLHKYATRREAAVSDLKVRFNEALDQQEEILSRRYEQQLARELSARWDNQAQGEGALRYDGATVLLADLLVVVQGGAGNEAVEPEKVAGVLQAARDSLYLFGATQVLPYGPEVLAVFSAEKDDHFTPAASRAAKAAFALRSSVATTLKRDVLTLGLTVALHRGDVTLLRIQDPLHGDGGLAPVPGAALQAVSELHKKARERKWVVGATDAALEGLPADAGTAGARGEGFAELRPA
jgi:CheY-like chemotaxis protein